MGEKISFNNDWRFNSVFDENEIGKLDSKNMEKIRIPHSFAELPFNSFSPKLYQKISLYKKTFVTEKNWSNKKVLLTVGAAAHFSKVYCNGKFVGSHECGYTSFTFDLTDHLLPENQENVLDIVVDSREDSENVKNIPPFGNRIDYLTYGGIYREVFLEIKNPVYIEDVFVTTKKNRFNSSIKIHGAENGSGYSIKQTVVPSTNAPVPVGVDKNQPCFEISTGVGGKTVLTSAVASGIGMWTLENPALYMLNTILFDENDCEIDRTQVRFGFRDIRFDSTGFYLNDKKIKLRGLNRHQSFPYVGYAMPKNMQKDDADILKFELGLNEVRTSHYPQSHHFIDRCDEIGLLVFTEIPGWQHIGGEEWKNQAVQNVRDMVVQYRNHPSIFMWGVRINESPDDDDFYKRTNQAAKELDNTRPTAGVRCIKWSHFFEDVYTYNDFSHTGNNSGAEQKRNVTKSTGGYMVTEYNGHMFPTKSFDDEAHRTEHAIRHANVLNAVAANDEIGGSSGWCAFDYNTHGDFGSGDYVCYHGVMDQFRNPKLASYVYSSQEEPEVVGDVLAVTSSMDIGEYPGGVKGPAYIFTNADSVRTYVDGIFIKEYRRGDSEFKAMKSGPILIDDYIGNRLVDEDGFSKNVSDKIKKIIFAAQKYGMDKIPFKYKLIGAGLVLFHGIRYQQVVQIYGKYIGNWGGTASSWRFDAVKNGSVVKTVVRCPGEDVNLCLNIGRTVLEESETYDVCGIRFSAVDKNGNVQPYFQEAVTLRCEGAVSLIGPSAVSLKGGMAGCYVKTAGMSGKGRLVVTDWSGNESSVDFEVIQKA